MRVLILCDDGWHPRNTACLGLAEPEDSVYELEWIEDARASSAERMAAYPVVLLSKSDNITADDESNWVDEQVESAV
jgi:hypothetical protein